MIRSFCHYFFNLPTLLYYPLQQGRAVSLDLAPRVRVCECICFTTCPTNRPHWECGNLLMLANVCIFVCIILLNMELICYWRLLKTFKYKVINNIRKFLWDFLSKCDSWNSMESSYDIPVTLELQGTKISDVKFILKFYECDVDVISVSQTWTTKWSL